MEDINVYQQYFAADAVFGGVPRKGVSVMLTAASAGGEISYTLRLCFFPHQDAEDFAVSYDAEFSRELYRARGRRSRKREAAFLEALRENADALAKESGGTVDWEHPLTEPRLA